LIPTKLFSAGVIIYPVSLERMCKNFGRCNWIERFLALFAVFPDFLKLIPKRRKYHEQNE